MIYIAVMKEFPHGPVKIGNSKNINRRLSELQCGNPFSLKVIQTMPGNQYEEAIIHTMLHEHRVDGGGHEWYHQTPTVKQLIKNPSVILDRWVR